MVNRFFGRGPAQCVGNHLTRRVLARPSDATVGHVAHKVAAAHQPAAAGHLALGSEHVALGNIELDQASRQMLARLPN